MLRETDNLDPFKKSVNLVRNALQLKKAVSEAGSGSQPPVDYLKDKKVSQV